MISPVEICATVQGAAELPPDPKICRPESQPVTALTGDLSAWMARLDCPSYQAQE